MRLGVALVQATRLSRRLLRLLAARRSACSFFLSFSSRLPHAAAFMSFFLRTHIASRPQTVKPDDLAATGHASLQASLARAHFPSVSVSGSPLGPLLLSLRKSQEVLACDSTHFASTRSSSALVSELSSRAQVPGRQCWAQHGVACPSRISRSVCEATSHATQAHTTLSIFPWRASRAHE